MFHASICEYYSPSFSTQDAHLERYNRSTGIEIRGIFPVPDESRDNLRQYEKKRLYDTLPAYTEDVSLIKQLDKISMREDTPNPCGSPVQMIVFCPMMHLDRLLTNSMWITNTLDISMSSWYVMGMSRNTKHAIFCKQHCYHIEQDKKRQERERRREIWIQQQQALMWVATQKAEEKKQEVSETKSASLPSESGGVPLDSLKEFPTLPNAVVPIPKNYAKGCML